MGQLEDILKHQNMVLNNIMKSFGVEISEDSLEKGVEDEINPFEMEAYKSDLTKAELDEFEKAKHQDGDMHPNGKWVWRQSANGGKGDWRVAKPGSSKDTAGSAAASTRSSGSTASTDKKQVSNSKISFKKFVEDGETWYEGELNGKRVRIIQEEVGKDDWWNTEVDGKLVRNADGRAMSFETPKEAAEEAVNTLKTSQKKSSDGDIKVAKFMDALKTVNSKYTDESKVSVMKTPKGNWEVSYDGHVVGTVTSGILSENVAKEKGWLKEDGRNNEKTTSSASNEEKFADMDIKEAKKKLVGKNLTLKDYWSDGRGKIVDATGKITNVRLYGKNKQPVALVDFENGDRATVSLKQIDEGKAVGYDLLLSDGSKSQQKQDTNNEVSVKDVKAIETFPDLDEDKYLKRGNKVLKEYTLSVNINGKKIEGTTHEFWASNNLSNTSVGGFETTIYIGMAAPLDKHVKTLEEAKSLFLSTVKKKIGSSSK